MLILHCLLPGKKVSFVHHSLNRFEEEKVSDMGVVFPCGGLKCDACVGVCRLRMGTPTFTYHWSGSD